MNHKTIESSGLLYFYLCGHKKEDDEIVIDTVNTYSHLPDEFYAKTSCIIREYKKDKDVVNLMGVMGTPEKVCAINEVVHQCIKENYNRILAGQTICKRLPFLDELGNLYNRVVQECFCENPISYPKNAFVKSEDFELHFFYIGTPENSDFDLLPKRTLDIWLEKEKPILWGRQIMIRSFYLKNFVARKLLAALPFGCSDSWNLVFEGGRSLSLDSDFDYPKTIPDMRELGFFSASGIESVLLDPIYAYGKWFVPQDLSIEWHKIFLYVCALWEENWDLEAFRRQYERFLLFLEENICEVQKAPVLITKEKYWIALLTTVQKFQNFLKGEDEVVISKELLQVVNSRYTYLPFIFPMFSSSKKSLPPFSQQELHKKIESAIRAKDTYSKGTLWEDAAAYYLKYIDGLKITGKRVRAANQEIDISVANLSQSDALWQMGAYILVECKNYKDPVSIEEIRNIAYICNMKGCKTALLFVVNGITSKAREEILRLISSDMAIVCISKEDLMNLNSSHACRELLIARFRELKNEINNEVPF